jgi:tRNA pseudouridine55 synthase
VAWAGAHDEGPDAGRLAVDLEVDVGKGYYVRSLAHDLGAALGVPSTLARLRRTASGAFTTGESVTLAVLADMAPEARRARLLSIADATRRVLAVATLTEDGARRARSGQALAARDFIQPPTAIGPTAWLDECGALVGIGEARGDVFVVLRNLATGSVSATPRQP